MSKQKKFYKGNKILTIGHLCDLIEKGEWIYMRDIPKHHGFIRSMTLNTLIGLTKRGCLFKAKKNKKEETS